MFTEAKPTSPWQDEFIFNDTAEAKIDALVEARPDSVVYNLDWDRTLTTARDDRVATTTWGILRACMTDENQTRHRELYRQYGPLERNGSLTSYQSRAWQHKAQRLLIGVPLGAIEEMARAEIELRDGVGDMLETCATYGIPTVIKSTGAAAIIQAVCKQEKLEPTRIFSNVFHADESGVIKGFAKPVVHSLNKHRFTHDPRRLLSINVGDNLHDAKMADQSQRRIRVGRRRPQNMALNVRLDGGIDRQIAAHGQEVWNTFVDESFKGGFDLVSTVESVLGLSGLAHVIGQQRVA